MSMDIEELSEEEEAELRWQEQGDQQEEEELPAYNLLKAEVDRFLSVLSDECSVGFGELCSLYSINYEYVRIWFYQNGLRI